MNDSETQSATIARPLAVVAEIYGRLEGGTLADRVYLALRQAILLGDVSPRTRLPEQELASVIPASRTPIREALRRLRDEGLVIMGSSRILEVKDVNLREILNTYQIIEVLEPLAARLAAERITDRQIAELCESVDLTEFFFEKNRWEDVTRESQRYHELIYEASGNDRLVQLIRRLREETHRFRRFGTRDHELVRRSLQEDREIIDALARRDPDTAFQVMYEHLHVSTLRVQRMIDGNATLEGSGSTSD